MSRMPTLEYPVTRSFPGLFAPIAILGAIVSLAFLATLNAALAGYETVTAFDSDFNVTQTHWFDRFTPSLVHKSGTLCDPRVLALGETFNTNYTLFQYSIASIDVPNTGDSGLSYKGWTLDNCDITSLYVNADDRTVNMDLTAIVTCRADGTQVLQGNNYEITARTDWSESTLSGKYNSLLGAQKAVKKSQAGTFNATVDARGAALSAVSSLAAVDFATRVLLLDAFTNGSFPSIISFQADFPLVPCISRTRCSLVPPLNISSMFLYKSSRDLQQYFASQPVSDSNKPLVTNDTLGIISNIVQSAYAAVRLDLGNPSPNNFLLNTAMISEAITATFPQTFPGLANESLLYSVLVNDGYEARVEGSSGITNITGLLPLTLPGPAVLQGLYLCHFQRAKSLGSAFIAVLVGTLSMFYSGWAIFLAFAATVVKKRVPSKNACAEHATATNFYDEPMEKRA
ncbi:hypothetical protein B0H14DRAFT_3434745 [Mycena olivaceomarginata]|nr:hypothetical protein B0H14DRAFT_3434745 [Mycena olivaceomarginata]